MGFWAFQVLLMTSSVPLPHLQANWYGSSARLTSDLSTDTTHISKLFITTEVRATGLKSSLSVGHGFLAAGTVVGQEQCVSPQTAGRWGTKLE